MTNYAEHSTPAPDDTERFHLDEDGYAFVQERCSGCGDPYVTFALAVPDVNVSELAIYGEDATSVAEGFVVVEKHLHEEQLSSLIKKLTESLIRLRSHQQLLKIAHSHRG